MKNIKILFFLATGNLIIRVFFLVIPVVRRHSPLIGEVQLDGAGGGAL